MIYPELTGSDNLAAMAQCGQVGGYQAAAAQGAAGGGAGMTHPDLSSLPKFSADTIQVDGSHYMDMPIQPWTVMQAVLTPEEFRGFLKASIIKYAMRDGKKVGATKDADKARHYRQKLMEVTA